MALSSSASPLTAVSPRAGLGPRALRTGDFWAGVSGAPCLSPGSFPTLDCQTALWGWSERKGSSVTWWGQGRGKSKPMDSQHEGHASLGQPIRIQKRRVGSKAGAGLAQEQPIGFRMKRRGHI